MKRRETMMNRLSTRERQMLGLVLGIAFVIVNLVLLTSLHRRKARIDADLSTKSAELASYQKIAGERDLWAARDAWLTANQPKLANKDQAGVKLLNEIRQAAQANGVVLENPELGAVTPRPACQSVSVSVQTKSTWPALIRFLNTLQQPKNFIVFETANLQANPADRTKMQAHLRIAKWHALN